MSSLTSPPLHFPNDEVNYRLVHIKNSVPFLMESAWKIQEKLRINRTMSDAEEKASLDQADEFMEEHIIQLISEKFPNDFLLCEHKGLILGKNDFRWVIDAIDGSMNFLRGIPLFCISIGLQFRNSPVCGIVLVPSMGEVYHAIHGEGAYKNDDRLYVSSIQTIDRSLLISSFPTNRNSNMREIISEISAFVSTGRSIRRTGSLVLDLCWLAEGKIDGIWEKEVSVFDMTAAGLIVHEAGGSTSNYTGDHISGYPSSVIASNGYIHSQIVDVLKKSRQELNLN
jgi:myo-inositol-1(or 4)-monophosphatase